MAVWSSIFISKAIGEKRIDAEYYTPEALQVEKSILSCFHEKLFSLSKKITDFGAYSQMNNVTYSDMGRHRFIRNQDIKGFYLDYNDNIMISNKIYNSLSLHLNKNDILVQRTGSIGKAGIVLERDLPATANQNLAQIILNEEKLNPFYLITYFNSRFGIKSFERLQTGNVQPWLNLKQIGNLKIPCFDPEIQNLIGSIAEEGISNYFSSINLYSQAQQLLESELGLNKLSFKKPVGFTAWFSELELSRRTDAEFYHIKYEPFLDAARNYKNGCSTVGKLTKRTLPNFDAGKHEADFDYIEIGDISTNDGTYGKNQMNAVRLPANAKIKLSGGEILISQVRPTRGAIAIIQDHLTHESICSGAFYVCTANDPEYREIIWLYLRSIRNVFEKYCGGTSYPTIDSRYISKFPVPLFDHALAQEIKALIRKSKSAKQESEQLLEQAKTRVEQLIEDSVKS
jgi:restriction endonuclease S subunit